MNASAKRTRPSPGSQGCRKLRRSLIFNKTAFRLSPLKTNQNKPKPLHLTCPLNACVSQDGLGYPAVSNTPPSPSLSGVKPKRFSSLSHYTLSREWVGALLRTSLSPGVGQPDQVPSPGLLVPRPDVKRCLVGHHCFLELLSGHTSPLCALL